jgi:hypothetical protein
LLAPRQQRGLAAGRNPRPLTIGDTIGLRETARVRTNASRLIIDTNRKSLRHARQAEQGSGTMRLWNTVSETIRPKECSADQGKHRMLYCTSGRIVQGACRRRSIIFGRYWLGAGAALTGSP